MNVSLEYLERCAGQTGYEVGTLEKVTRLGEIAAEIAKHPILGEALALKGGTALNLCMGEEPTRMSVDLDYNYIAHVDREEMLADRPQIEEMVEELVRRLDYYPQRSKDDFAGRKIFVTYDSVLGTDERVKVDLNYLFRVPLAGVFNAEMWQPGELDRPRIKVVSTLELCVGKFLALLDRAAPRDAWDVVRLPTIAGDVLSSDRFRRFFLAMSAILDHPVSTYTQARMKKHLTTQVIDSQLIPMLATDEPPDAAELIEQAWNLVSPLVETSAIEAKYVNAVNKGKLRPEILFPDDAESAKIIETHPAVRWKIENVRKHRSGKTTQ